MILGKSGPWDAYNYKGYEEGAICSLNAEKQRKIDRKNTIDKNLATIPKGDRVGAGAAASVVVGVGRNGNADTVEGAAVGMGGGDDGMRVGGGRAVARGGVGGGEDGMRVG